MNFSVLFDIYKNKEWQIAKKNNFIKKIKNMKEKLKEANTKINLSVPTEFADLLTTKAHNDYMPLATWVKSFLMKNLLKSGDKRDLNINENGNRMEN